MMSILTQLAEQKEQKPYATVHTATSSSCVTQNPSSIPMITIHISHVSTPAKKPIIHSITFTPTPT